MSDLNNHRIPSGIIFGCKRFSEVIIKSVNLIRSHHPRGHSPRRRVRRQITAGLTLIFIAAIFSILFYNLVGERFNSHIISALTRLSGGEVEVEESTINILSDIRIKKLRVYQPGKPHKEEYLILSTSDLLLEYNPWSVLTQQLQINRIVANEALVNLAYNYDQKSWNVTSLSPVVPQSSTGGNPPNFIIRNSNIQFIEFREGVFSNPVRQQFTGQVSGDQTLQIIKFKFESDEDTSLPNCKVSGIFDPTTHAMEAELKFDMENFTSKNLPPNLNLFRDLYDAINPQGELTVKSVYSPSTGNYVKVLFDKASARINISDTGLSVPLPEISGEIVCTNTETTINSVQVKYDDATFNVRGKVVGYDSNSEVDLEFSSPDLNLPSDQWVDFDVMGCDINDTELVKSLNADAMADNSIKSVLKMLVLAMPPKGRTNFNDFLPTGSASVDVNFVRKGGKNFVNGKVDLISMAGRFIRFPYPVTNASGPIWFERSKIKFGPITGSDNGQSVVVTGGAVRLESGRWDIETDVQVKNVRADEKLYAALNDLQKGIYDLFKPQGRADAHYHINVVQGESPNHYIDISFRDCSGRFKFLPVPLDHCYGNIHWDNNITLFSMERGEVAGGTISLDGDFVTGSDSFPVISCQVAFDKFNLDEKLMATLPAGISKFSSQVKVSGTVSGTAQISHVLKDGFAILKSENYSFSEIEHKLALHLSEGVVQYAGLPLAIEKVDSEAEFVNGQLDIKRFEGKLPHSSSQPGTITLTGTVAPDQLGLDINCQKLEFSDQLRDYIEAQFPDTCQKYQPTGTADVKLQVRNESGKSSSLAGSITPVNMSAAFMGYRLDKLTGSLDFTSDSISFNKVAANNGTIEISGLLNNGLGKRDYNINVITRSLSLDNKLKSAFGKNILLFNDKTDLRGMFSSEINLKLKSDSSENNTWHLNGQASLTDGFGNFPLACSDIFANFKFAMDYNNNTGAMAFDAGTSDLKAKVEGRPLEKAQATLTYDSVSGSLAVKLIDSRFCSGIMAGDISAEFRDDTSYNLDLSLKDAWLNQMSQSESNKDEVNGLLNGYFRLAGAANKARGSFQFDITQGSLGKLPLLSGILNLIKFTNTHPGIFNRATIVGDIVNDKTIFSELSFKGNTIEVSGSGTMVGPLMVSEEQAGAINLVFMIEAPDIIKPIPFVGSFFNAIRSGLIYVVANGTYHNPIIEPVTLAMFTELFKLR